MIDINIEFTKGILFIRLKGILNESNERKIEDEIFAVIREGGIRFIVFNISELKIEDDISLFENVLNIIKNNDGKMILCGEKDNIYADTYEFTKDELSALKKLAV